MAETKYMIIEAISYFFPNMAFINFHRKDHIISKITTTIYSLWLRP